MNDVELSKTLALAPECDKRCGWCLSFDNWTCVNYEDTDYGTTIYTYRCDHIDRDSDMICNNEVDQEFEEEKVS